MPLECQKDLFGTFHTVGVGREGAWGLCPKRELGVCQLRLPMFIMLVIFLDILLVVSILNIVYDCHLWPLLHFCPEGVVNNFCGIYGYIFAWELPFLMCVCVCVRLWRGRCRALLAVSKVESLAHSTCLPIFILLVSFSQTLLVVSISDMVYDCHLWPLLQSWRSLVDTKIYM